MFCNVILYYIIRNGHVELERNHATGCYSPGAFWILGNSKIILFSQKVSHKCYTEVAKGTKAIDHGLGNGKST